VDVDPVYSALAVGDLPAHASTHEPGGADEVNDIDIGNTGVLLSAHKSRHEPGGADEIAAWTPLDPFSLPAVRMDRFSMAYWDGTYWVCRNWDKLGSVSSVLWVNKTYGYGTYQWKGKITMPSNAGFIFMGFEKSHGFAADGLIAFVVYSGPSYRTQTVLGVNIEENILAGQDWTVERTFRIEWSATQVVFKVDGATVATHTTVIPPENIPFFIESGTHEHLLPDGEQAVYARSFEVI